MGFAVLLGLDLVLVLALVDEKETEEVEEYEVDEASKTTAIKPKRTQRRSPRSRVRGRGGGGLTSSPPEVLARAWRSAAPRAVVLRTGGRGRGRKPSASLCNGSLVSPCPFKLLICLGSRDEEGPASSGVLASSPRAMVGSGKESGGAFQVLIGGERRCGSTTRGVRARRGGEATGGWMKSGSWFGDARKVDPEPSALVLALALLATTR